MNRKYIRTFEDFKESPEYEAQKVFKDFSEKLKDYFSETGKCTLAKLHLTEIEISGSLSIDLNVSTNFNISSDLNNCNFVLTLSLKEIFNDKKLIHWLCYGYDNDDNFIKSSIGDYIFDDLNDEWIINTFITNTNKENKTENNAST